MTSPLPAARRLAVPLLFALGLVHVPAAARADGPAPAASASRAECVFKTVLALEGGDGSMDPQITMLREDLHKPPFTAWKTFRMLDRKQLGIAEGAAAAFTTPDGRPASLTYVGHVVKDGQHNIRVVLEIGGARSTSKTAVTLSEGGHFVVAGHRHQGGILVHAVSCKTAE